MDDSDSSSLDLSDFLGSVGQIYNAYEQTQLQKLQTTDAAKIAQAKAAEEAAKTQGQFAVTDRTKKILLYTFGGILAIILVLFVVKKLK